MERRIFVTVLNGLFVVFGSYIMAHTYLSSVDRTWSKSYWLNGFWWYLTWPTLNIIAIWWRTQSRAQRRRIILPTIVTIGNSLIIVLSFVGIFLLLFPNRFSSERYEVRITIGMFSLLGLISSPLNIMAIWRGRSKLERETVQVVISTLAGLLAWAGFVFYSKDTNFLGFGRPILSRLVFLGFFVGVVVFFIVLAISALLAFVNRKK